MSDSITPTRKCNVCQQDFLLTAEYWHKSKAHRGGFVYTCKVCARKKSADWLAANPERNKANCRRRYYEAPEKRAEYTATHTEQIADTKRNWRRNNPDKVKKHKSDSQKRNRASANARVKRHYQKYPERALEHVHARRARKLSNGGRYTAADIDLQLRSQRGLCWWCNAPLIGGYHIDHRIPLSRGGSNNPENLCLTCPTCNLSKNNKLPHEWTDRLL